MNEIQLTYSPYNLKFKKPFQTSRGLLEERKGFIIKLSDDSGTAGYGDAAPMEEYGSESYGDAERAVNDIKIEFKIDLDNVIESVDHTLSPLNNLPTLRHGVEQALLNLICKKKNISLNKLLGKSSLKIINVNAVIGFMTPDESSKSAKKYIDDGYSVIKVKAGRESFEDDIECIKAIREAVGKKVKIRIDVNGKWNYKEAVKNIKSLDRFNIEYVEQPVSSLNDFKKLPGKIKIPIAADELIRSTEDAYKFIENKYANVLVLKPMMIGGLIQTLKILDKASENDVNIVVSSSFESSIGRSMAVFAASLIHENLAHGLATSEFIENDIADDPYPVKNGKIFLQ